jgi:two-component system NarL family sensor kinase
MAQPEADAARRVADKQRRPGDVTPDKAGIAKAIGASEPESSHKRKRRAKSSAELPRSGMLGLTGDGARPGGDHSARFDDDPVVQRTIDALSSHIAILGETGKILAVNRAWRNFAQENGFRAANAGVGLNYLEVCQAAAGVEDQAWRAYEGIEALLIGGRTEFKLDYDLETPQGLRRFALCATRVAGTGPTRIVVAHEDVTSLKLADEKLRHLLAKIHAQEDDTRRQIARELHDVTAQKLVAASLLIAKVDRLVGEGDPIARKGIAEARILMEESLSEIRSLSYLFHPPLLEDLGLVAAMRAYVDGFGRRTGIAMRMEAIDEIPPLPRDAELALYRVLQEALGNVYRHAKSKVAVVRIYRQQAETRLEVEDRGVGISGTTEDGSVDPAQGGVGLLAMKIRMAQIGGDIEIQTGAEGTRIRATLPDRVETGRPGRPRA